MNDTLPVYTHIGRPKATITRYLATILSITFMEFLVMGISLGVLPGFVHETLGYNNLFVGIVIGAQYAATLATRSYAGKMADEKGGRKAVINGLLISALSGAVCLSAILSADVPLVSYSVLLAGRILLGIGESMLIIGIFAWGFTLVGPQKTGKVMVWNGMGMYGGMAVGAPLGIALQTLLGTGIAFTSIVLFPLISIVIATFLPRIALPQQVVKLPFLKAVGLVWKSGSGLALASIGFGGIASFISLYFLRYHWAGASLALTFFGIFYILVRLFFAHFPDKFGGARVALVSLLIEVVGQVFIWLAPSPVFVIIGSALTGIGISLVFPSFGLMAVKRVDAANRGMAMAAYNAFFDLGMGITAPLAGLIAAAANYETIYLFGAATAVISAILAFSEYRKERSARQSR